MPAPVRIGRWRLRDAVESDLPALAALDSACFGNPWSAEVYRQELVRSLALLRVAVHDHGLHGLSCTWIVGDEAHLLRISTALAVRGAGLGRALLGQVLDHAATAGCRQVLLEVAAANVAAVGLYRAFGFERIGVRRGYYRSPPDDAWVLRRALIPASRGADRS